MKKLVTISMAMMMTLGMATTTFAATTEGAEGMAYRETGSQVISINPYKVTNDINVISNGHKFEFNGDVLSIDSTTFFPMREVLNNLGVSNDNIEWDPDKKEVTFSEYNHIASFAVGSKTQVVDGTKSQMAQAPFIYNDSVYLPIRYVAQALGFDVTWDNASNTIGLIKDGINTDTSEAHFVDATVLLNGSKINIDSPVIETNNVAFFPVVELATALGGENFKTDEVGNVTFTNKVNGDIIVFNKFSNEYTVNGETVKVNNDTITYDDKVLYAPISDIANSLGYKVSTDENNTNTFGLTKTGVIVETPFVDATVLLNGSKVTVESPIIEYNDVDYFPIVEFATALGGENFKTDEVGNLTFTNKVNNDIIVFNRFSNEYTVNGETVKADNDTITYDDTVLYAPIKDIANSLGYKVSTDENNANNFGLTKTGVLAQ